MTNLLNVGKILVYQENWLSCSTIRLWLEWAFDSGLSFVAAAAEEVIDVVVVVEVIVAGVVVD